MYAANSQIEASALLMRDVPALNTLTEYVNHFRSELSCAGWYLYEKKDSFGIATRFENGKPKKTLCVLIRFFDRSTDTIFSLETQEPAVTPRELTSRECPWRVDSWRFGEGKTVQELRYAFAIFLAEARAGDPATAKNLWAGH